MSGQVAITRPSQPTRNDSVLPGHLIDDIINVPVTPAFGSDLRSKLANADPARSRDIVKDYFGLQAGKTESPAPGTIISATFTIPRISEKKEGSRWVSLLAN